MPIEQKSITIKTEQTNRQIGNESLEGLSARLNPLVTQLQQDKASCLAWFGKAANTAAEVGAILLEAEQLDLPGFKAVAWAEDYGIRAHDAVRYMALAQKVHTNKIDDFPVRTLLVALELLPETSGQSTPPTEQKLPTFQLHINRLGQLLTVERVTEMDSFVRMAVLKQLRELIARLEVEVK